MLVSLSVALGIGLAVAWFLFRPPSANPRCKNKGEPK